MKKYKFTDNIGLKVMGLVFAALLWLIVVNVDDPVETSTFRNVPITIQNSEVVTNDGKTYRIEDVMQTESVTVSVIVKAKRSVLAKISTSNIVATADMSEMQLQSLVPITATLPGYEGKYTAETSPRNLKVKIEDQRKHDFPLTVSASGTPRDGYVIGEMTTNPEEISVGGSESMIASIDKVVAKVDVTGLSKSSVLPAELVYYDSVGNVISRSQLNDNIGEDGVTVNVQVLNTKNLTLDFNVSGTPAEGYVYSGYTCEPEKIQVCGTAEALAEWTELEIPAGGLDISGTTEKLQKTVDILPYLPEGIKLVDETANNVIVTVAIEQEGARTIEFPVESIRVNNLQDNLKVSYETNADIALQFKGAQEILNMLDVRNAVSIDMKSFTKPGTYDVKVDVEIKEDMGVTLDKNPVIKVIVTEKDNKANLTESKAE